MSAPPSPELDNLQIALGKAYEALGAAAASSQDDLTAHGPLIAADELLDWTEEIENVLRDVNARLRLARASLSPAPPAANKTLG